jgi:hypothetical protein
VLFLNRPKQSRMPFPLPRPMTQQDAYRWRQQQRFDAASGGSRPRPTPPVDQRTALAQLDALHRSGVLDDAELAAARARVLGWTGPPG